jgi:hypothetical protein
MPSDIACPEIDMARRKVFKGVAIDIARSFVSRNNDVDGYWGVGKLHSLAKENSTSKIRIDLSEESSATLPTFASMIGRYRSMIEAQAAARGLKLQTCSIEVEFDLPRNIIDGENGFRCWLTIVDDRGKAWSHMVSGRSHPHDPKRESRSLRAS